MSTVIKVENLSKQYRLGTIGTGTIAHDVNRWWHRVRGKEDPYLKVTHVNDRTQKAREDEYVWALQDINFEIAQGDVVGIIGRNGAGKSTLLKILSRTTLPTTGSIKVKGRIASLLEVGTGFHPELTGRENIFLNGAILGMRKAEIRSKFDEIVDFAGVEKYIDTPVKRYSSGMYVRLAFAVAAHLDPEILIVDEVLAVGDSLFQKKCIDKMIEVSQEGRTILFVSHNLSAVKALCTSCMVIEKGGLKFRGDLREGFDIYLEKDQALSGSVIDLTTLKRNKYAHELVFQKVFIENLPLYYGHPIRIRLQVWQQKPVKEFDDVEIGIAIHDKNDNCLIHCGNRFISYQIIQNSEMEEYTFEIQNQLRPGRYSVTLFLRNRDVIQDWISKEIFFNVEDGNPYDYLDTGQIQGAIFPDFRITSQRRE